MGIDTAEAGTSSASTGVTVKMTRQHNNAANTDFLFITNTSFFYAAG